MFGLDFDESPPTVPSPSTTQPRFSLSPSPEPEPSQFQSQSLVDRNQHDSPAVQRDKGKQKAQPSVPSAHSPSQWTEHRMPSATQCATPPVPLGQRLLSTQTATQQIPDSPDADAEDEDDSEAAAEESSDGEIPIRPRPQVSNTQRRPIFDPLNFDLSDHDDQNRISLQPTFTSRLPTTKRRRTEYGSEMNSAGESTDSAMLSEYERSKRPTKSKKRRAVEPTNPARTERAGGSIVLDLRQTDQSAEAGTSPDKAIVIDDESIPASESVESYSLSKQYPSPPKPNIDELRDFELREVETRAAVPVTPAGVTGSRSRSSVDTNVQVTRVRTEFRENREIRAVSPVLAIHRTTRTTQFTQVPQVQVSHDPDSLGSSKTGSGNTQSLPTPPPSDDQEQEETDTIYKRHPDTVHPVLQSRATAPSKSIAPQSHKRESVVLTGPSPSRGESSRSAPAAAPAPATGVDEASGSACPGQGSLALDLTVDGLSEDTVQRYIARINTAREKQRSRSR